MISDLALSCSMRWPAAYCPSGSRLAASTEVVSTVEERATARSKTVMRIPALNSDILGESEVDEDALHFLLLKTSQSVLLAFCSKLRSHKTNRSLVWVVVRWLLCGNGMAVYISPLHERISLSGMFVCSLKSISLSPSYCYASIGPSSKRIELHCLHRTNL